MVDIDDRIRLLAEECQYSYLQAFMEDGDFYGVGKLKGIRKIGRVYTLIFDHDELDVSHFFELVEILKRLPIK